MPGADFDERRKFSGAGWNAARAAWFEGASGGQLGDGRDCAFDGRERKTAVGRQSWNGAQQALRIGMRRGAENIPLGAEFDQVSGVHYGNAIGDMRDDG